MIVLVYCVLLDKFICLQRVTIDDYAMVKQGDQRKLWVLCYMNVTVAVGLLTGVPCVDQSNDDNYSRDTKLYYLWLPISEPSLISLVLAFILLLRPRI